MVRMPLTGSSDLHGYVALTLYRSPYGPCLQGLAPPTVMLAAIIQPQWVLWVGVGHRGWVRQQQECLLPESCSQSEPQFESHTWPPSLGPDRGHQFAITLTLGGCGPWQGL